jgi:hypothetical protein
VTRGRLPDSPLVVEAESMARAVMPAPLLWHSMRTYLLAEAYADIERIGFDREGLAVASLLHDIALFHPYCDPRRPFPFNSSRVMMGLLDRHQVAASRVAALVDAVDFHFQLWPHWQAGPEAGLLHVGAYMDVVGSRRRRFRALIAALDRTFPRAGLMRPFLGGVLGCLGRPVSLFGLFAPGLCDRPHRRAIAG